MRRFMLVAIAFLSFACLSARAGDRVIIAADSGSPRTSEPGASLVIEDWKCTIENEKGIRCDNTTPYCVKLFQRTHAWQKRIFGCAVKDSPNYPCNDDDMDPRSDAGADRSDKARANMFRYNYAVCGPHGVGQYTMDP